MKTKSVGLAILAVTLLGLGLPVVEAKADNTPSIQFTPPLRALMLWTPGAQATVTVTSQQCRNTQVNVTLWRIIFPADGGPPQQVGYQIGQFDLTHDGNQKLIFTVPDGLPTDIYDIVVGDVQLSGVFAEELEAVIVVSP